MIDSLRRLVRNLRHRSGLTYLDISLHLKRQDRRLRPAMLSFYAQFVRPGDLCFDVGASVGSRTAVFLELGARVVALEPEERCLKVLRRRFCGREVEIVPAAAGNQSGSADFYLCPDAPGISTLSTTFRDQNPHRAVNGFRWLPGRAVRTVTLDELIKTHGRPAFVKIDVEGYELEVLLGLSQPLPALSYEFHREFIPQARQCAQRLAELGPVELNYSDSQTMAWQYPEWMAPEALLHRLEADGFGVGDIYARTPNLLPS